jgi:hypothetical protein
MCLLVQEYAGPPLDWLDVQELEASAARRLDQLNAAVALYLTAFAGIYSVYIHTSTHALSPKG